MSLRDDLIAARALIDTPEKASALGGPHGAMRTIASVYDDQYTKMQVALRQQFRFGEKHWPLAHADILTVFDRAIAAARPQETGR